MARGKKNPVRYSVEHCMLGVAEEMARYEGGTVKTFVHDDDQEWAKEKLGVSFVEGLATFESPYCNVARWHSFGHEPKIEGEK